jgi:hypothetical protein
MRNLQAGTLWSPPRVTYGVPLMASIRWATYGFQASKKLE